MVVAQKREPAGYVGYATFLWSELIDVKVVKLTDSQDNQEYITNKLKDGAWVCTVALDFYTVDVSNFYKISRTSTFNLRFFNTVRIITFRTTSKTLFVHHRLFLEKRSDHGARP